MIAYVPVGSTDCSQAKRRQVHPLSDVIMPFDSMPSAHLPCSITQLISQQSKEEWTALFPPSQGWLAAPLGVAGNDVEARRPRGPMRCCRPSLSSHRTVQAVSAGHPQHCATQCRLSDTNAGPVAPNAGSPSAIRSPHSALPSLPLAAGPDLARRRRQRAACASAALHRAADRHQRRQLPHQPGRPHRPRGLPAGVPAGAQLIWTPTDKGPPAAKTQDLLQCNCACSAGWWPRLSASAFIRHDVSLPAHPHGSCQCSQLQQLLCRPLFPLPRQPSPPPRSSYGSCCRAKGWTWRPQTKSTTPWPSGAALPGSPAAHTWMPMTRRCLPTARTPRQPRRPGCCAAWRPLCTALWARAGGSWARHLVQRTRLPQPQRWKMSPLLGRSHEGDERETAFHLQSQTFCLVWNKCECKSPCCARSIGRQAGEPHIGCSLAPLLQLPESVGSCPEQQRVWLMWWAWHTDSLRRHQDSPRGGGPGRAAALPGLAHALAACGRRAWVCCPRCQRLPTSTLQWRLNTRSHLLCILIYTSPCPRQLFCRRLWWACC